MRVKYSFIVPVYNVEKYLSKCIDSLLAQTYKLFEIIIVDDGTPDSSGKIADQYQKKYPDKVKTVHQDNTGQGGARNHGLEIAQGEYILFVDGDDFVSSNMLEIIDKYTVEHDDDLLFFQWESIDERQIGNTSDALYIGEYEKMPLSDYVYQQPSPWRKVYKASIFRNKKLRFPSKIFYEDLSLAPCLVAEVEKIGVIREKLYYYVQHKNSTMHSKNVSRLLEIMPAFDFVIQFFKENELFEQYYKEIEWLAIQHILYYSCCRISYIEYNRFAAQQLIDYMNRHFPGYKTNPYIDTFNEYVKEEEIDVLLKDGYDLFDKQFFAKKRRMNRIKDIVKKMLRR